jgi:hypothetical protein
MNYVPEDVLVAGYQDVDAARSDFDGLAGLVKAKQVKVEGVVAFVPPGWGGGKSGCGATQGDLFAEVNEPGKS